MRSRVVAVAVLVVGGVLMSGASASGASCMDGLGRGPRAVVTDPGTRLPVIAVHGWRSSASVWDVMGAQLSTLGENPPALSRFDYSHVNDQWVTHLDIGPRLAEWIDCLAEVSLVSGGSGRVALVGHSMGGLAIRAALDGDGARAAKVAFIATLGTPHQGSVFGGDWSLNDDLRSIGGALGDMLIEWVTMHGPAKAALGAGSRELASLPAIPSGPPVLAAAGNLILESRVLFWTSSQPVGDGLVGQASATAQNAQVGNLGGTDTMECRIATTLTGVAPTDLFSAPPLVLHQIEKYGWNCIHTKLPQSPHLINALAAQLTAAARTPSVDAAAVAQDVGCVGDCAVTGLINFDHPTWGSSTLVTYLTPCGVGPTGILVYGPDGRERWRWELGDTCVWDFRPLSRSTTGTAMAARYEALTVRADRDALGHLFIQYNPGRYDGLVVLVPTTEGFDDIGSLPKGDAWAGRFYYTEAIDMEGDGQFEIVELDNDCVPSCAGGTTSNELFVWNGTDYARLIDVDAHPYHYSTLYGQVSDGDALWSGCSPEGTELPDGVWMGHLTGWNAVGVDFDLACDYGWPGPFAQDQSTRVVNDNPQLRRLPWSADTYVYLFDADGFLIGPEPVSSLHDPLLGFTASGSSPLAPPPVLIYVNGGVVTGLVTIHRG